MTKGEALGHMLKLVEDGVLVRNTKNDSDLNKYMTDSVRLVLVLKEAQEALKTPPNEQLHCRVSERDA